MAEIFPTSLLNDLNGVPVSIAPNPKASKNTSSPPNISFHPGEAKEANKIREEARGYSEEMRQRFIRRVLKNLPRMQKTGTSISIEQYNGQPRMVNPPYGFLPFALLSEKGLVDKDALTRAINFCADRKKEYEQSGDFYRMWLYARRESMLAGILTHMVKFRLV